MGGTTFTNVEVADRTRFVDGKLVGVPVGGPYTIRLTLKDGPTIQNAVIGPVYVGDLWVLAGQSNMEGVGDLIDVTPPNPLVLSLGMDGTWARAEEPLHWLMDSPDPVHSGDPSDRARRSAEQHRTRAMGAGLGLPFAVALVEQTRIPIDLVCCAHGGTSMEQWSPAKKGEGGISLYDSFLRQVKLAGGKVKGVLWYQGEIVPADKVPGWKPEMINQFDQDDLYVEMTFLRTLEQHGLGASARQAGIDFANSRYPLRHANRAGRDLFRKGIAPPDSGHPALNSHADDIDYQIEADFSGLIAPGLPNTAVALGETFGRLMNAGDGLYGGQFMGSMYAEAFFEKDMAKIVQTGLAAIPRESQYHECISDVLAWHRENPGDWEWTWNKINEKYQKNLNYRRYSCSKNKKIPYKFSIDAKQHDAYIIIELLYGKGNPDRTIAIATRCGQDSDCNPASAARILFTTIGYSRLDERFVSGLELTTKFNSTPYTVPQLIAVCEQLADQAVRQAEGRIDRRRRWP